MNKNLVFIWSNEWKQFWGPNSSGYTNYIEDAGLYERSEAESTVAGTHGKDSIKEVRLTDINKRMDYLYSESKILQGKVDKTDLLFKAINNES